MSQNNSTSNPETYKAHSACAFCEGTFAHEAWCATKNPGASYAIQIVLDPSKIDPGDALILHSLGVSWAADSLQV